MGVDGAVGVGLGVGEGDVYGRQVSLAAQDLLAVRYLKEAGVDLGPQKQFIIFGDEAQGEGVGSHGQVRGDDLWGQLPLLDEDGSPPLSAVFIAASAGGSQQGQDSRCGQQKKGASNGGEPHVR